MENISKNISYHEATFSATANKKGLKNIPSDAELENMKYLAEKVFQPVRERFGIPILVNSFFRSIAVNKAVKGSKNSQHTKGEAIDIEVLKNDKGVQNRDLFFWIKDNLEFDQLIWEHGDSFNPAWIHVSIKKTGTNRKQVLYIS